MRVRVPDLLPLFRSELQTQILALLLLESDRNWTLDQLQRATMSPGATVHREVQRAERAGIVIRDRSSRPHRFQAATDSPVFECLRTLLERTVGVEQQLREAWEADDRVLALAIHGSWAAGAVQPNSDIDVIMVGVVPSDEVRRWARVLGKRVGRQIDLSNYRPDEYRQKFDDENGFVRLMHERPLRQIKGDLAKLVA